MIGLVRRWESPELDSAHFVALYGDGSTCLSMGVVFKLLDIVGERSARTAANE